MRQVKPLLILMKALQDADIIDNNIILHADIDADNILLKRGGAYKIQCFVNF